MKLIKSLLIFLTVISTTQNAFAVCGGVPLNPVIDVAWQSIFPIKVGGVRIGVNTDNAPFPDMADLPICACPIPIPPFVRPGISLSFFEPARIIETTKDPFCLPSLGFQVSAPPGFFLGGSNSEADGEDEFTMTQAHYFIFPVWTMMELLTDFACVEQTAFDVAYLTEIDPLWQDDDLTMLIQPEVMLFANPIAQMACVADSVGALVGLPIPALFWCAGSFGSIYPLTGHVIDGDYVQAQGAIAARLVYKLARSLLLWDTGINICAKTPTPIWYKLNYRFQIAKPVRGLGAIAPGRTSLLWGAFKNPPIGGTSLPDNFSFILFKKRVCCAF